MMLTLFLIAAVFIAAVTFLGCSILEVALKNMWKPNQSN